MPDMSHLLAFIAAGWLLNLTPGPDVFYVVSHTLRGGVRAGLVAGFGITAGCFVHVAAAAVGLSALLAASATAFNVLKWLGAAYLLWMGWRMLRARPGTGLARAAVQAQQAPYAPDKLRQVFAGGFVTNVLNPKVALFFLAFIPQFIAPDYAHKDWAFMLLGTLFNINAIPVNVLWALAAASLTQRAAWVLRHMHWLDRVAGAMFVGFGVKLALTKAPSAVA
ncbi:LysE family translocator [Curvibacter sp. CHRR-16]|uniref:LysE family translocator n=1 Tax=Curvibacter sp. CHRR-16 TaxID=2835872 RepID=UPI001BDA59A2|nr:LysE family translocator [Curvibacter sp. CHRR-16]MBT0570599.1 LysE family translocator [Curvibacter sp. CHRR-16]